MRMSGFWGVVKGLEGIRGASGNAGRLFHGVRTGCVSVLHLWRFWVFT